MRDDPPAPPAPPPPDPLTGEEITALRDMLALLAGGYCLVPCPTAEGQMLKSFDSNGSYEWSFVEPPTTPDNQDMRYGTSGPYWLNVMGESNG